MRLTIVQALPALESGGVERGTLEIAAEIVRRGHRSIVVSQGGRLVKNLVAGGSEHINLPVGKKSVSVLLCVKKLARLLAEENVSILHARSRLPAWICFLALKKIHPDLRPKFVTTVHGQYSVNRYSKIMVRGDRIIAVSDFIKNYISDNYPDIDTNNISIIPRGVSITEYPPGYTPAADWLADWHINHPFLNGKYIVTLPARLTRLKGHEDFINILGSGIAAGLPLHGLIVGGAAPGKQHYLDQLRNRAVEKDIKNNITFIGHRDDLREIMAISNVVLSLTQIPEAFGRTVLEALSIGRPVIAYNHGGVSEIMRELYPAGCVEPFDTAGVVNKLKEFSNHSPPVNGSNPFTLESMQQKTMALYRSFYN